MNGLERMDTPRRWPLWAGVGIVMLLVATLVWQRLHKEVATPAESGIADQLAEDPVSPPVGEQAGTQSVKVGNETGVTTNGGGAVTGAVPPAAVAPVAAAPSGPDAVMLSRDADALLAEGRKDKAREQYLSALAANPEPALRSRIETSLGALNVELISHPWPMSEKQDLVVQEGDSIKALARKAGTTVEMIVKGNQLKRPDIIRPGQHLKVFTGKMGITVSKTRNDLLLTANDRFFKRYRVGTGRYDKTPVGSFEITERIPEPPWWREDGRTIPFGDKENILGTRWMAIKATGTTREIKGYGLHGTWDTNTIGKAESAGCIRLVNSDIEELFEMVPVGTAVIIEE